MSLIEQGGWVLLVIFALSLGGWALIVWKWLELRAETSGGYHWARAAVGALRRGDRRAAMAICETRPSLMGRLMMAAIETNEPERRFFEKRLTPWFEAEAAQLRQHLDLIAVVASVLPLLGLLGTVLGMVVTFDSLTSQAMAVEADRLAGGISQALITTQAGLVVALPILLMQGYLRSRIGRYLDTTTLLIKQVETIACPPRK